MTEAEVVPPNEPVSTEAQAAQLRTGDHQNRNTTNGSANSDANGIVDPKQAEAAIAIQAKYAEERNKRLLPLEVSQTQYLDLNILKDQQPSLARFNKDPWLTPASENIPPGLHDGAQVKHLILGAGMCGLLAGVKLTSNAGVSPSDIFTVDIAGGWGGTWYWNRYPGLMCDITSYHYLPRLQEMGYMPRHRYSYGGEIREYMELLVKRYGLGETAMFRTKIESATWDEGRKNWAVRLRKSRGEGEGENDLVMSVYTQFLTIGTGVLVNVKLPNVDGVLDYQGHMFHTSRFDYGYSGGSPNDPHPQLSGLEGKRVGIIGTGATAIQVVPEVAKYAKELYVFQRTPSGINKRGQTSTDVDWWKTNIQDPNWLKSTRSKFANRFTGRSSEPMDPILEDGWLHPPLRTFAGGAHMMRMEDIPAYVSQLYAEDFPRAESVRARVDEVVQDPKTASKLKAWYATWCKRLCFHDDYLPAFNKPNVHLVDTDGKGISRFTRDGVVANDTEYPLDLVILATGFRAPAQGWHGSRSHMQILGRNGRNLDEKFDTEGFASLHGLMTNEFPNLFIFGPPFQSGITANFGHTLDVTTDHMAEVVVQASKRPGVKDSVNWTIEPTKKAEEDWTMQILTRAASFAGMAGCTPGYNNGEGAADLMTMEEKMKRARGSPWGEGIEDFARVIGEWEAEGKLEGFEVVVH